MNLPPGLPFPWVSSIVNLIYFVAAVSGISSSCNPGLAFIVKIYGSVLSCPKETLNLVIISVDYSL